MRDQCSKARPDSTQTPKSKYPAGARTRRRRHGQGNRPRATEQPSGDRGTRGQRRKRGASADGPAKAGRRSSRSRGEAHGARRKTQPRGKQGPRKARRRNAAAAEEQNANATQTTRTRPTHATQCHNRLLERAVATAGAWRTPRGRVRGDHGTHPHHGAVHTATEHGTLQAGRVSLVIHAFVVLSTFIF